MTGSVNKVILIGHLGRDPDVRHANAGNTIVSFSIATSETWRDKQSGERMERTEWHNVVVFNESLAKLAEQYLKKGSKVYLAGKLVTRDYQDKDGNRRRATEVVLENYRGELTLLDSQRSDRAPPATDPESYGTTKPAARAAKPPLDDPRLGMVLDDDIDF